jgi:hypothetical protein
MSAQPAISDTPADREAAAAIWTAVLAPWRRAADLAECLGVDRSLVHHYASGARSASWAALRGALRSTAARHPEGVSALVQAVARELLDVRGTWIPECDGAQMDVGDELDDVTIAHADLVRAIRRQAPREEIERLAGGLQREANEAGAAALAGRS